MSEPVRSGPAARYRRPVRAVGLTLAGAVGLVGLSAATVVRFIGPSLHADGVMQSVMSLQGVELFFWGQNRFLSVVPALAAPIADPDPNLLACLLLDALSFHLLLLLLAWSAAAGVTSGRRPTDVAPVFAILVATVLLAMAPYAIYTAALDSQPHSLSWLLALGGFLLWRRAPGPAWAVAAAATGVAIGLNQSVVLGTTFLAAVEAVRTWRRRDPGPRGRAARAGRPGGAWLSSRRWVAFAAMTAGWLAVWFGLAARFGRTDAIGAGLATSYYGFDPAGLPDGLVAAGRAVLGAVDTGPAIALAVVAGCSWAVLDHDRRSLLGRRAALLAVFGAGYLLVFAGNPWVAVNGYPARYFFPVVLAVMLGLAVPIAAALPVAARRIAAPAGRLARRIGRPLNGPDRIGPALAGGLLAVAIAAAGAAPATPRDSWIFQDVRATAEFARDTDVSFVAGTYWVVWPLTHRLLAAGRPVLAANYKAGGDPARYPRRLEAVRATGMTPRALCLNDSAQSCRAQLDRWTRPGWQIVPGATCPVAEPPPYADSTVRDCVVLEFRG
ncbi:hypothetical protein [Nakamurella sp.]|uniref:hypothetical protein n=1 Tax=Nakamurella sp. TaxID=1869182 RepID=UPI003B3AB9B2